MRNTSRSGVDGTHSSCGGSTGGGSVCAGTPRCFATGSADHLPTWDEGGVGVLPTESLHSKVQVLCLLTELMFLTTTKMSLECCRNVRRAEHSSLSKKSRERPRFPLPVASDASFCPGVDLQD